jgi:hypothetical protein
VLERRARRREGSIGVVCVDVVEEERGETASHHHLPLIFPLSSYQRETEPSVSITHALPPAPPPLDHM